MNAATDIGQLEFRRRALLDHAVDCDRQADGGGMDQEDRDELRAEAHAARQAAKTMGADTWR